MLPKYFGFNFYNEKKNFFWKIESMDNYYKKVIVLAQVNELRR